MITKCVSTISYSMIQLKNKVLTKNKQLLLYTAFFQNKLVPLLGAKKLHFHTSIKPSLCGPGECCSSLPCHLTTLPQSKMYARYHPTKARMHHAFTPSHLPCRKQYRSVYSCATSSELQESSIFHQGLIQLGDRCHAWLNPFPHSPEDLGDFYYLQKKIYLTVACN